MPHTCVCIQNALKSVKNSRNNYQNILTTLQRSYVENRIFQTYIILNVIDMLLNILTKWMVIVGLILKKAI